MQANFGNHGSWIRQCNSPAMQSRLDELNSANSAELRKLYSFFFCEELNYVLDRMGDLEKERRHLEYERDAAQHFVDVAFELLRQRDPLVFD